MTSEAMQIYIPNAMENWPLPRTINSHFEEVRAESNAWFRSFKAFSPQSQYAFEKCDFGLLAGLAYPWVSRERLRTGCDLMNLLFAIDEYTDVDSESSVREMTNIVLDAFKNPHKPRPNGEVILGEIARQCWELAIKTASQTSQRHMIEGLTYYLNEVVKEAAHKDNNSCHSIKSYLENRRGNLGSVPSYVVMELDLDLQDEVFYHHSIVKLTENITDLLIFDNDITSYNKEQAVSDDHSNILTIVMHEFNTDLEGAINKVVQLCTEVEKEFFDGLKNVPSWGPEMDCQVRQYLYGLANWRRANDCWTFECGRYFGNKGLEIQKTRVVRLLPKTISPRQDKSLRRENVVVPLIEALETTV